MSEEDQKTPSSEETQKSSPEEPKKPSEQSSSKPEPSGVPSISAVKTPTQTSTIPESATELSGPSPKQDESDQSPSTSPQPKKKDNILFYAIIVLFLFFAAFIFLPKILIQPEPTLEELHLKNLEGKLAPDKGYIYNEKYSFVYYDDLWYGAIAAPHIDRVFSIPFHYGPREVEDIVPQGVFNKTNLDEYENFFMTFDPTDDNLGIIGVSIGESNRVFTEVFGKGVIGSCTNTKDIACETRPIVECNSTDAPVFYYADEEETNVLYLNNCAIMSGSERELFRATDRMLFDMLGVIE